MGEPGDLVLLGDWSCDGIVTPAVLRPLSGEVFVFSTWTIDDPVVAEPIAVIEDAQDLAATDDVCPHPLVATPTGPVVVPAP